MSTFTELVYISQFDIQPNGCIGVRKTTDVLKDGVVISSTYWRTVLVPNDPQASSWGALVDPLFVAATVKGNPEISVEPLGVVATLTTMFN